MDADFLDFTNKNIDNSLYAFALLVRLSALIRDNLRPIKVVQ